MIWRVADILPVIAETLDGAGVDLTCSPRAKTRCLERYNRINEILMNKEDWPGTELSIATVADRGVLTLHPHFETITGARVCGKSARIFAGGWQYLDGGPGVIDCNYPIDSLTEIGTAFPTWNELREPQFVGCMSSEQEDPSAVLRINGAMEGGGPIRQDGMTGFAMPIMRGQADVQPFVTPFRVQSLDALSKPVTKGHVDVFGWSPFGGGVMNWLTRMESDETTPCLTRYRLSGIQDNVELHLRVSLRFRDLRSEHDVSLIQHRESYRLACQALNFLDAGDGGRGSEFMNRALKLLKDRVGKLNKGKRKAIGVNLHRNSLKRRALGRPW